MLSFLKRETVLYSFRGKHKYWEEGEEKRNFPIFLIPSSVFSSPSLLVSILLERRFVTAVEKKEGEE